MNIRNNWTSWNSPNLKSGSNTFQNFNATDEERAAICIQKFWRGYCQRKRYLKDLNEAFFEEDERRIEEMLAQVRLRAILISDWPKCLTNQN